eukprot:238085-Hanusia_phi.AAC.1
MRLCNERNGREVAGKEMRREKEGGGGRAREIERERGSIKSSGKASGNRKEEEEGRGGIQWRMEERRKEEGCERS